MSKPIYDLVRRLPQELLTPIEKSVLLSLAYMAHDGKAYPKIATLMKYTNASRSAVFAALAKGRKLGILMEERSDVRSSTTRIFNLQALKRLVEYHEQCPAGRCFNPDAKPICPEDEPQSPAFGRPYEKRAEQHESSSEQASREDAAFSAADKATADAGVSGTRSTSIRQSCCADVDGTEGRQRVVGGTHITEEMETHLVGQRCSPDEIVAAYDALREPTATKVADGWRELLAARFADLHVQPRPTQRDLGMLRQMYRKLHEVVPGRVFAVLDRAFSEWNEFRFLTESLGAFKPPYQPNIQFVLKYVNGLLQFDTKRTREAEESVQSSAQEQFVPANTEAEMKRIAERDAERRRLAEERREARLEQSRVNRARHRARIQAQREAKAAMEAEIARQEAERKVENL